MSQDDIEPHEQGTFDGLCGMYAILNGMRLALYPDDRLTKLRCRLLFKRGLEFLESRECFDVARHGMSSDDWHALARYMFDDAYNRYDIDLKSGRTAFRKLPNDRDAAIAQVEAAVARGIPVAIELQPALDHYTVVRAVDDCGWRLFDSHGYAFIKQRSLASKAKNARHQLGPRAIFFIPRF